MVKIMKCKKILLPLVGSALVPFILVGCRGQKSTEPPILPIQNMVEQTSYGPQSKNEFYKDQMANRPPVPGTVAQGEEKTNKQLYLGQEATSTDQNPIWVKKIPIKLDQKTLKHGQDLYNIYCSLCHGKSGDSNGLVTQRSGGAIRPSNIHDQDRLNLPVGKIYDAVRNGVNNWNMPGFAAQMTVEDRWAVVSYVRALQLSRTAKLENIPDEVQVKNGWSNKK
ncbi:MULTISPECIES: c-type cytochrome [Silvanigrella]|jgi:mono/diheme cytochrome c family protein|nr:cytochrome c [Silvanigrella paludirubra]MBX9836937.1 cytochrome c [Silvanigrellaceae bacterium]